MKEGIVAGGGGRVVSNPVDVLYAVCLAPVHGGGRAFAVAEEHSGGVWRGGDG